MVVVVVHRRHCCIASQYLLNPSGLLFFPAAYTPNRGWNRSFSSFCDPEQTVLRARTARQRSHRWQRGWVLFTILSYSIRCSSRLLACFLSPWKFFSGHRLLIFSSRGNSAKSLSSFFRRSLNAAWCHSADSGSGSAGLWQSGSGFPVWCFILQYDRAWAVIS